MRLEIVLRHSTSRAHGKCHIYSVILFGSTSLSTMHSERYSIYKVNSNEREYFIESENLLGSNGFSIDSCCLLSWFFYLWWDLLQLHWICPISMWMIFNFFAISKSCLMVNYGKYRRHLRPLGATFRKPKQVRSPLIYQSNEQLICAVKFPVGTFVQRLLFGYIGEDNRPIPLSFPPTVDHLRQRFEQKYGYRGKYLVEQLGNGYFRYSSGFTPCYSCRY